MKIDRVVVTGTAIQHRVPDYSVEMRASALCIARKTGRGIDAAQRAYDATVEASTIRKDYDAGAATLAAWDAAELKRQDASLDADVRSIDHWAARLTPNAVLKMVAPSVYPKKEGLSRPVSGSLTLENTDLITFTENGREIIAISGVVRNASASRVELPPVTLRAIDRWEFVLAGLSTLLPFETLGPGEARRFEVRYTDAPDTTAEVYIHFAPPFWFRTRRDCYLFDEAPVSPETYSAAELSLLSMFYRNESTEAWACASGAKPGCNGERGLYWRDLFLMADAIDEARDALIATMAVTADTREKERSIEQAMRRVSLLGERALARAGTSVEEVEIEAASSTLGRDEAGLYVEIAGTVRNAGAEARTIDALMVAFVDRFGLPLSTVPVKTSMVLAPGEMHRFLHRLQAGATKVEGQSLTVIPTTRAERRSDNASARLPPEDIHWEIRIGAMAADVSR